MSLLSMVFMLTSNYRSSPAPKHGQTSDRLVCLRQPPIGSILPNGRRPRHVFKRYIITSLSRHHVFAGEPIEPSENSPSRPASFNVSHTASAQPTTRRWNTGVLR
ncbi:hypothetical protein HBI37_038140 [Parastagonospora nodorum]|nr:hypothetical protein HBI68_105500 [Parastagonospora nodorum]KAH6351687.1 hypothetical protein HBI37_038140 [Parastagonospora nodorum]KAH6356216.1 hypothetical protein HBI36_083350 [Parastagonospora nodorum]KAH6444670.1 hypothetical protein HBI59_097750 [Parastagonospora nodorum]